MEFSSVYFLTCIDTRLCTLGDGICVKDICGASCTLGDVASFGLSGLMYCVTMGAMVDHLLGAALV